MKPVYQQPMDGECMRAAICSLFEIPMEAGPEVQCPGHMWSPEESKFICSTPEHRKVSRYTNGDGVACETVYYNCEGSSHQDERIQAWAARFGLRMASMYVDSGGNREVGPRSHSSSRILPPGLCIASGGSPRFAGNHAVVWDTRLHDYEHPMGRMVHDPADLEGKRPGLKDIQQFHWFEVEDPALLRLAIPVHPKSSK